MTHLYVKLLDAVPNVNRDVPTGSTYVWLPLGAAFEVAVILLTVISELEFKIACLLFNNVSVSVFVYIYY